MFDFDQLLSNADWVKQTDDSMAAVMEARKQAYEDEEDDDEEEEKEDYRRALNREFYRRGFYGKDFKEGEHPRDEGGKFSEKEGGGKQAKFQTGVPVTFDFVRNTESAPQTTGFGQDVEPSGRYLSKKETDVSEWPGWESGTVSFNSPLVLDFGGSYADDDNWKRVLSRRYDGKTGEELSDAIREDGYDAIVTEDKYGTSEIVDLTGSSGGKGTRDSLSSEDADRMMQAAVEYAKKFDKKQFGTPDVVSPPKGAESLLTDPIGTRRSGECYESAGQFMMEAALTGSGLNAKMIHGTVKMGDQRIGHGWVEIGDVVYDGTHTQFFDRDSYREFTEAETEHEYDWEECSKHMVRTENWGPWEETAGLLSEEHYRPGRNE